MKICDLFPGRTPTEEDQEFIYQRLIDLGWIKPPVYTGGPDLLTYEGAVALVMLMAVFEKEANFIEGPQN